jgi:hypothetical protein
MEVFIKILHVKYMSCHSISLDGISSEASIKGIRNRLVGVWRVLSNVAMKM